MKNNTRFKTEICLRCLRLSRKLLRAQLPVISHRRHASSFSEIRDDLLSRQLPLAFDTWNSLQSNLLRAALTDFLPRPRRIDQKDQGIFPTTFPPSTFLQPGFHLIYFPPASRESELLPDGTDPLQSPGPPYVRRMWAGGSIQFRPQSSVKLRGAPAACQERITDVILKGKPGEEKLFITLERRMGNIARGHPSLSSAFKFAVDQSQRGIREDLDKDENCGVIEHRSIVFLQAKLPSSPESEAERVPGKILKPMLTPDFTHTLVPTPTLLYRFSGLTFNAHRIHLDKQYCQQVEQHRGLLVHGPLSLVIMMQVLKRHLTEIRYYPQDIMRQIESVEYRNLAPLYAEESMTVCVCNTGETRFEVWIQGPDGGIAVRGVARVRPPVSREEAKKLSEKSKATKQPTKPKTSKKAEEPKESRGGKIATVKASSK